MNGISKIFETNLKEILMVSNKSKEESYWINWIFVKQLKNKIYLSLCSLGFFKDII